MPTFNNQLIIDTFPYAFSFVLGIAGIVGALLFLSTLQMWYNAVQRNETAGRTGFYVRRLIVAVLLTMPATLADQFTADLFVGGGTLATSVIDISSGTAGLTSGQMMARVVLLYFQLLGLVFFSVSLYTLGNMGNPEMAGSAPSGKEVMWKMFGGLMLMNVVTMSEVIFFAASVNPIKDAAGL